MITTSQQPTRATVLPTRTLSLLLFCGMLFLPEADAVVNLRGAGASFPVSVYQTWLPTYSAMRQDHVTLNMSYDPVGSGKGITMILANEGNVEYAGTDSLLTEAEKKSDLVLFPTMAGGTVLAYQVPDCDDKLNLTREHVVGIYNGTFRYWNESSLQEVNPACQLPDHRIFVFARKDKSGTTDMFTRALSSFSKQWEHEFGVFSDGVYENGSSRWSTSVIWLYGKGTNGISGLVDSIQYSIGYMAVSSVGDLPYARIQNIYGEFTLPTSAAIQAAMDSKVDGDLAVDLANTNGAGSYPIVGYTFLAIYLTTMTSCDSAKELVRYTEWFITSEKARTVCEKHTLVPVSITVAERIREEVLKLVTCQGINMWAAVQEDIQRENEGSREWMIPVAVSVPLLALLLMALLGHIAWQRHKMLRMIANDDWDIPIEDILFFEDRQTTLSGGKSRVQMTASYRSFVCVDEVPNGAEMLNQILQWPGKWKANVIGIRLMELKELRQSQRNTISRAAKKSMLSMRDVVVHTNVVRFFGLTQLDSERYVVGEYCSKGSMVDILQNGKYNLNNDFKFSLAADIATGMAFLHSAGFVHGLLTSSCCLIDARWTVKIADWEFCRLLTILNPRRSPLLSLLGEEAHGNKDCHAAAFKEFWVAPELIREEFLLSPAMSSDVYSFAIILQEIYTREDPYFEHADTMIPRDVVRAVCNNHLRPALTEDIPIRIRQIMETAWSENSTCRPSFEQIIKMLRHSRTSRKTLLDSMMETMEEYTTYLEEQVAERTAEVMLAKRNLEIFLASAMPPHLASRFINGEMASSMSKGGGGSMKGREYPHLGVVVMEVLGVHALLAESGARNTLVALNDFCLSVDAVVSQYSAFRGPLQGDIQIIALGLEFDAFLEQRCTTATHIALHLLSLLSPPSSSSSASNCPSTSTSTAEGETSAISPCLEFRAGVHVGRTVSGVVGGTVGAPRLVLIGEGVEVSRTLAVCSRPGRVLVSRNVFSHLEKNLDFVTQEAGWIVSAGMEVESFWVMLRIPKTFPTTPPSDNSVDSGVEVERLHHQDSASGGGDSSGGLGDISTVKDTVQNMHRERPQPLPLQPQRQTGSEGFPDNSHRDGVKENEDNPGRFHKFFQTGHRGTSQQSPAVQPSTKIPGHRIQPPTLQKSLSDIVEEDERTTSPLLMQQQQRQQYHHHKQQQKHNHQHQQPAAHNHLLHQQQQQQEQQHRKGYQSSSLPSSWSAEAQKQASPLRIVVTSASVNPIPTIYALNTHSSSSDPPSQTSKDSLHHTHAANNSRQAPVFQARADVSGLSNSPLHYPHNPQSPKPAPLSSCISGLQPHADQTRQNVIAALDAKQSSRTECYTLVSTQADRSQKGSFDKLQLSDTLQYIDERQRFVQQDHPSHSRPSTGDHVATGGSSTAVSLSSASSDHAQNNARFKAEPRSGSPGVLHPPELNELETPPLPVSSSSYVINTSLSNTIPNYLLPVRSESPLERVRRGDVDTVVDRDGDGASFSDGDGDRDTLTAVERGKRGRDRSSTRDRDRSRTKDRGRRNRDISSTGDSGRRDRDISSTGDSGRRDRDRSNTGDSGRRDRDRSSTGDSGRRDRDRSSRGDSRRRDRDRSSTGDRGRRDRDRSSRGDSGRRDRDRSSTEDSGRRDRDRSSTGDRGRRNGDGFRAADRGQRIIDRYTVENKDSDSAYSGKQYRNDASSVGTNRNSVKSETHWDSDRRENARDGVSDERSERKCQPSKDRNLGREKTQSTSVADRRPQYRAIDDYAVFSRFPSPAASSRNPRNIGRKPKKSNKIHPKRRK